MFKHTAFNHSLPSIQLPNCTSSEKNERQLIVNKLSSTCWPAGPTS